jgi:pimeloyl-ACP methyl ester carboxylesterase
MGAEKTFSLGKLSLNYYEGPDHGPPLVLLHGVTSCWQSFLPLIPFLTPLWKVYALDFRGHGKSGRKAGHYRKPDYVADVGKFIDAEVQEPVILLGHSLGGLVSLLLAEERPGEVRAVIAGDTSLRPFETTKPTEAGFLNTFRQWKLMLEKGSSLSGMSDELGEMVGRTGPDGAPQLFKEYWDATELRFTAHCLQRVDLEILDNMANRTMASENDPLPRLDKITCPVLFLQADPALGALLTDADLATALNKMPSASVVRLQDAGHGLHREKPLQAAQAILSFLATL